MNACLLALAAFVAAVLSIVPTVDAINCFSCNSAPYLQGDRCRDLPDKNEFLINCDEEPDTKALGLARNYTMCRIFVQDVEGESRIVRTCATDGKPERGCIDRTGTTRIKLRYCECTGDACNEASKTTSFTIFTSLLVLVVALVRL